MAIYRVTIGAKEFQVNVAANQFAVNGEPYDASLTPLNSAGLYLLRRGAHKREMHVASEGQSRFAVLVDGRHVVAEVEKMTSRLRKRLEQGRNTGDLKAPMPARVVDICVQEGDEVEKGQVLVVLESMKMQMDFRSPAAGKVTKLHVQPGVRVEKDALMVQIA